MLEFLFSYNDFALLLLRITLGIIMVLHGFSKLFKEPQKFQDFLKTLNFKAPKFLGIISGIAEFFGGLSLIIGFFTQIAAFLIFINMAVATFVSKFKLKKPFIGGWEFDILILILAFSLIFLGPGIYSIDWFLFK